MENMTKAQLIAALITLRETHRLYKRTVMLAAYGVKR